MSSILYWRYISEFSNEHYQRAAHSIDTTLLSLRHSAHCWHRHSTRHALSELRYLDIPLQPRVLHASHVYCHTYIRFRQHSSLSQKNFWPALVPLSGILLTFI